MTIIPVKEGCARKSLDDKMNFGKFAHLTVEEVARSNPNYLVWAVKNIPWFEMDSLGRACDLTRELHSARTVGRGAF